MGKTYKDSKDKKDDKWMQKAFSRNKGKLHRELGVSEDKNIPVKKLNKAMHSKNSSLKKEANLAKIGRKYGGRGR